MVIRVTIVPPSDSLDSESKCEVAELAAESSNSLDDPSTTRVIDQCAIALNLTISQYLDTVRALGGLCRTFGHLERPSGVLNSLEGR